MLAKRLKRQRKGEEIAYFLILKIEFWMRSIELCYLFIYVLFYESVKCIIIS